jgi:hypothetical protein
MNNLILVEKIAQWQRLKALVLDSVSSPITKRVYNMALDEFMVWFKQEPRRSVVADGVKYFGASTIYVNIGTQVASIVDDLQKKFPTVWADLQLSTCGHLRFVG